MPEHQQTLDELLDCLISPPVMAYPNYEDPFILHVDASRKGLGTVLYQKQNGTIRVIGYGSRTLTPSEQNYHLHSGKLEFLGLKWAVTEHFKDYLYYSKHFTVFTDNNPLTYVLSTAKAHATGLRWVGELSEFNFNIKYRPEKISTDVDTLSRMPFDINCYMEECTEEVSKEALQTTYTTVNAANKEKVNWITAVVNSVATLQAQLDQLNLKPSSLKVIDLTKAQIEDRNISKIIQLKQADSKPSPKQHKVTHPELRQYMYEFDNLFLSKDGLLCRRIGNHEQVVLPQSLCRLVYEELHENMGHLGLDRVYQLAKDRFYWPYMRRDIDNFIHQSCSCLKQRRPHIPIREPLQPIVSTAPFDLISIDFVHLETSIGGYQYILVVVDHFTKFPQAFQTRNKSGTTVADKIFSEFIPRFGFPGRIIHDQGGEFESDLFKKLSMLSGIKNLRTTPYHPQGNGICERMNRTLLGMLRTLPETHKSHWANHLHHLIHAYNCTHHDTTGYSPHFLLFGRNPRLPIDLILNLGNESEAKSYPKYVSKWKASLEEAYKIVSTKMKTRA